MLVFLLFVNSFVFAQKNPKLEEQIKEQIAEIQNLIQLSKVRITLSSGSTPNFNPKEDSFFEDTKLDINQDLNDKLMGFFNSSLVEYSAVFPYSLIAYDCDDYKLQQLLGKEGGYFMSNWDKRTIFQPISVEYAD